MKIQPLALALALFSISNIASAFEPCGTPIPSPLPRGVQLFSPVASAASVPTNAAIVFAPLGGAALDVVVSDSAGAPVTTTPVETIGLLRVLHPATALAPGANYRVVFTDTASMPPQILSTSSFATGAGGDATPPSLTGAPSVAIGPFCAILDSYPLEVTWPAAIDADESVLAYSVTLVYTSSSTTGVAATTALTASFRAAPGTEFDVAVRAVDRTGAVSTAISQPVFVPGPADNISSGGCRCAVGGTLPHLGGSLGIAFGLLAIGAARRRSHREPPASPM